MPVLANGGTVIRIHANEVRILAHNAVIEIENHRRNAVSLALKLCMEEECVHRIPLLGLVFHRHKRYPSTSIAMRYAPEIHMAKQHGWGDHDVCKRLQQMADWLIDESGYPPEEQYLNVTLNDFRSLK